MIHMIVQMCTITQQPADQSDVYRAVCKTFGKATADKLTYEAIIPPLEEPCTTSSSTRSG